MFHFIYSSDSLASTHSPEVTNLAAVCTLLPICQVLSCQMAKATKPACLYMMMALSDCIWVLLSLFLAYQTPLYQ